MRTVWIFHHASPSIRTMISVNAKLRLILLLILVLIVGLGGSLVYAEPSQEMPAILGVIVQESEFSGDLFFLLAVNDNEEDNFWIKLDDNTILKNPFGEEVSIYDAHVGVTLVIFCYEYRATLEVHEAMMFYPDDGSEDEEESD
jgi:hypothetical protein